MRKFTEDHEWLDIDGNTATVGITTHAAEQLGDLVFVELPEIGKTLAKGDEAATVESVKAASEVFSPLDGEIVAVNTTLSDDPAIVNADPMGKGWFFKLKLSDTSAADGLLDEAGYEALIA